MRSDREKALTLRLQGHSYNEITAKLGTPKATLSDWFGGLVPSQKAQQRIAKRVREGSLKGLIRKNKLQTHQAQQNAARTRKIARSQIKKLSPREILLIGAALYWAEGYKRPIIKNGKERTFHTISFSNTDPQMIKGFIAFLKNTLEVPESKIYVSIRIFEHISEKEAFQYWQKITALPIENFRKPYYGISKSSLGKRPYNRLPYGTIQVTVGDTKNFHRIMGWIEGIGRTFY
jgi:hypothetical protein